MAGDPATSGVTPPSGRSLARLSPRWAAPDRGREWQGILLVIAGAICFSTAILFVRLTEGMSVGSITFYRSLFGFSFLCLFLPRNPAALRIRTYRPAVGRLALLGLIVGLTAGLFTYAIQHTTAAIAALLVNSAPVYVAILAPLLLHEPPARYTRVSIPLAAIGMVMLTDPGAIKLDWATLDGVVAAALSGITYGLAMMLGRQLRHDVSGYTQTLWSLGITTLMMLPFALRTSPDVVADNLVILIPLGVFSLGLSYLFYFMGLERVSAQVVSVVSLFEPLSGILIGLIVFGETLSLLGAAGGVLILISIVLISR